MHHKLVICNNQRLTKQQPSCGIRNMDLARQLELLIIEQQLAIDIDYRKCLSQCDKGPNMRLAPAGKFFHNVAVENFPEIIEEIKHFIGR